MNKTDIYSLFFNGARYWVKVENERLLIADHQGKTKEGIRTDRVIFDDRIIYSSVGWMVDPFIAEESLHILCGVRMASVNEIKPGLLFINNGGTYSAPISGFKITFGEITIRGVD